MTPRSLLIRALLAYSVHEHQEGHVRRIDVCLRPDGFTVQDDGRGMGLERESYVENLMGLLVGIGRPSEGVVQGPVQLHGVGLSLVAASTQLLTVVSWRGGTRWMQSFAWGVADGPPVRQSAISDDFVAGTRITVVAAADALDADMQEVTSQIHRWRERNPGLAIDLHQVAEQSTFKAARPASPTDTD